MRYITRRIEYASTNDVFRVKVIADTHLGNLHSDEKQLKEIVKEIKDDPLCYWIHLGDVCEFINLHDPRFDPQELVSWMIGRDQLSDIARAEADHALSIFQPIADKCLGICEGNHEESIRGHSECDVYGRFIEGMIVKGQEHRLDHRGVISLRFRRQTGNGVAFHIFCTHGSGGGFSGGAAALKLAELLSQWNGIDAILMGHHHVADYKPMSVWVPGETSVRQTIIHAISVPPLCGDMAYADKRDRRPVPTGHAELTFHPGDRFTMAKIFL